ncbi:Elongation factor 3 [Globisporangium polare]
MLIVSGCVWDTKKQVQEATVDTLAAVCSKIRSDDVLPLVQVIAKPVVTIKLETAIERLTDKEVVQAAKDACEHLARAAGGAIDDVGKSPELSHATPELVEKPLLDRHRLLAGDA